MKNKLEFRTLLPSEIDVRVGHKSDKGASLLLYKDARVDMNILDETVGALNWKREHSRDNANCTVSIYNEETKEWVSKEDTGTESNAEADKGKASDSFKRACVNWGIGRELYTAPFIWVKGEVGKFDKFAVEKITYTDAKEIDGLSIVNITTCLRAFVKKPEVTNENIL